MPNLSPPLAPSTSANVTVLTVAAITELFLNPPTLAVDWNDPIIPVGSNVPPPTSSPTYPANRWLFRNEPTVTVPTAPVTSMALPSTEPPTWSVPRAGLPDATPTPDTATS